MTSALTISGYVCLKQTNKQTSKANRKKVGRRTSGQRKGYMLRFLTIEVSLKSKTLKYTPPPPPHIRVHSPILNELSIYYAPGVIVGVKAP